MAPRAHSTDGSVVGTEGWSRALVLIVGPVGLTTPFLSFLQHNGYSSASPEALVVFSVLAALGLILSIGLFVGGPISTGISVGLIVGLWADIQLPEHVDNLLALAGVCLLAGVLGSLLRVHIAKILATAFGAFWLTTLVLPASSVAVPASTTPRAEVSETAPPLLVHLLFDAHIGIEGLPAGDDSGRALSEELIRFYAERGFLLYGRAYSEFFKTELSVSNMFNRLAEPATDLVGDEEAPFKVRLLRNDYFATLRERGYRISVYQTDFLNLCSTIGAPVDDCSTYELYSLDVLSGRSWSVGTKARALGGALARLSLAHKILRSVYLVLGQHLQGLGVHLPPWNFLINRLPHARAMETLNHLPEALSKAQRGDAYFAHLLLPHAPYTWDRDCNLLPPSRWLGRTDRMAPAGTINTAASRELRYRGYFEQTRCLYRKIDALIAAIDSNPAGHDAVILIHGDHGSRLGIRDPYLRNADKLVAEDYTDGFSTLFAVRSPSIEPGYARQQAPISELFGQLVSSDFFAQPSLGTFEPTVQFRTTGKLTPKPMPAFGWNHARQ